MHLLRRIFFYIFVAIYIVLCPLILLYAFGYIYKPGAEESVIKTGVIYLSTAPSGATIYVKGTQYAAETPTVVRGLLSGDYPIKLVLDGYKPWIQTVPVEVGKATVLDKILLMPLQWKTESLLSGTFQDLVSVSGSDYFLVARGATAQDILVYNYKQEKSYPLLEETSPFASFKVTSYFTVEKSSSLLLHIASAKEEKFLWIELGDDKSTTKDVTELFPVKPLEVEWLPQQEGHLFSFQQGYLNRLDVDSGAVYPDYVRNVRGYGLFNGTIYVLQDDNIFLSMDYDAKSKKVLMEDKALGATIFGEKGFFRVKILSEDFILFLGEGGELLANRLPYRFAEEGVKGIELDPQLKRALIWKSDRIGILDFSAEKTGDVQFEKGPSLLWAYREGKNIEQCFWVYDGSHILVRDGSDVFLVGIEEFGKFTLDHIFSVKEKSTVYYSEETGKMYFLDSAAEGLSSVEVVPGKGVIPSPFPKIKKEQEKENKEDAAK